MKDLDLDYLERLEAVIYKGKRTFVDVGLALEQIRQDKLYRKRGHKSFEEYCQKQWGWNAQRGRQLINSALVVEEVTEKIGTTVPISERAARELSKVPEESRAIVLKTVSDNGAVTAKAIAAESNAWLYTSGKKSDSVPAVEVRKDAIGRVIPDDMIEDWDRALEVAKRLRSAASDIKLTVERGLAEKDIIFAEITNPTISEAAGLHYTLSQIAPHSVCPSCQGKLRKNCQLCRRRGWISKFLYNSPAVSADTRALIEKVAAKGKA